MDNIGPPPSTAGAQTLEFETRLFAPKTTSCLKKVAIVSSNPTRNIEDSLWNWTDEKTDRVLSSHFASSIAAGFRSSLLRALKFYCGSDHLKLRAPAAACSSSSSPQDGGGGPDAKQTTPGRVWPLVRPSIVTASGTSTSRRGACPTSHAAFVSDERHIAACVSILATHQHLLQDDQDAIKRDWFPTSTQASTKTQRDVETAWDRAQTGLGQRDWSLNAWRDEDLPFAVAGCRGILSKKKAGALTAAAREAKKKRREVERVERERKQRANSGLVVAPLCGDSSSLITPLRIGRALGPLSLRLGAGPDPRLVPNEPVHSQMQRYFQYQTGGGCGGGGNDPNHNNNGPRLWKQGEPFVATQGAPQRKALADDQGTSNASNAQEGARSPVSDVDSDGAFDLLPLKHASDLSAKRERDIWQKQYDDLRVAESIRWWWEKDLDSQAVLREQRLLARANAREQREREQTERGPSPVPPTPMEASIPRTSHKMGDAWKARDLSKPEEELRKRFQTYYVPVPKGATGGGANEQEVVFSKAATLEQSCPPDTGVFKTRNRMALPRSPETRLRTPAIKKRTIEQEQSSPHVTNYTVPGSQEVILNKDRVGGRKDALDTSHIVRTKAHGAKHVVGTKGALDAELVALRESESLLATAESESLLTGVEGRSGPAGRGSSSRALKAAPAQLDEEAPRDPFVGLAELAPPPMLDLVGLAPPPMLDLVGLAPPPMLDLVGLAPPPMLDLVGLAPPPMLDLVGLAPPPMLALPQAHMLMSTPMAAFTPTLTPRLLLPSNMTRLHVKSPCLPMPVAPAPFSPYDHLDIDPVVRPEFNFQPPARRADKSARRRLEITRQDEQQVQTPAGAPTRTEYFFREVSRRKPRGDAGRHVCGENLWSDVQTLEVPQESWAAWLDARIGSPRSSSAGQGPAEMRMPVSHTQVPAKDVVEGEEVVVKDEDPIEINQGNGTKNISECAVVPPTPSARGRSCSLSGNMVNHHVADEGAGASGKELKSSTGASGKTLAQDVEHVVLNEKIADPDPVAENRKSLASTRLRIPRIKFGGSLFQSSRWGHNRSTSDLRPGPKDAPDHPSSARGPAPSSARGPAAPTSARGPAVTSARGPAPSSARDPAPTSARGPAPSSAVAARAGPPPRSSTRSTFRSLRCLGGLSAKNGGTPPASPPGGGGPRGAPNSTTNYTRLRLPRAKGLPKKLARTQGPEVFGEIFGASPGPGDNGGL